MWSSVLGAIGSESRDLALLLEWLASVRKEWEGDAADHLGVKIAFNFHAKHPVTPQKAKSKTQAVEAELG